MSPTNRPMAEPCFTPDEIWAILLGQGPAEDADRLARHLPACPNCVAAAEAIHLDDFVVSSLRREGLPPLRPDHEFADVVARVSRLGRPSRAGRPRPATSTAALPQRLGPYRLVELLGAGGMGVVYRAEDTALHRFVAVKVLKGETDAESRERFLREAQALAAVRHDNVVTVHHVGEEPTADGMVPYMAMELLEGQTLRDWMNAAPRPPVEWVVRLGRQTAAGLAFAHATGLVHRDVKPANLWLESPRGWTAEPPTIRPPLGAVARVKLLDFGLARAPGLPAALDTAGTLAYMAPEQARGTDLDGRADLFGLGCVLYELCTGRLPFPHRDSHWAGEPEALPAAVRSMNPTVPDRLADLIQRLLAADLAHRPVSARAVELELADLNYHSSGTRTVAGQSDATVAIRPRQRPKRRRRLVLAAALLVAAGAIAAIARTDRPGLTSDPPDDGLVPQPTAIAEKAEPSITDQQKALISSDVIDEKWCRALSTLPPQLQVNTVLRTLGRLNPKFEWLKGSGWAEPDRVIRLTVNADTVTDLRPVRALKALSVLRCRGSAPGFGILTDLSPLSELKLKELHCRNNPGLWNLSPIRLDNLEFVDASYTSLETLSGLTKAPLVTLKIDGTPIKDLGPARRMSKLRAFYCTGCPITDFEPLTNIPLRELHADVRAERDAEVLSRIETLVKINGLPVNEFWKRYWATQPK